jgi:chemotaxis signal transduction protein
MRLAQLREILEVPDGEGSVQARGELVPTAFVSAVLGLPPGPARFALVIEASPRAALRVEALHGIVDLADAEVFQLPARTPVPQPSPFAGALVTRGLVALELAVGALGFAPLRPAEDPAAAPPSMSAGEERELRFRRGGRVFAVPLSVLVQVVEGAALAPVPLTPPSHRGLLYHARSLHPVVDVAALYGDAAAGEGRAVVLLDVGGAGVGVVADAVLGVGPPPGDGPVLRPPWDALFAG